jgi:ferredoxin-NADP reductase
MILTLEKVEPVTGDVKSFVFTPDQPVTWQPGQYIHYTLPHDDADDRGDERWFTISSAPFEQKIQLTTRIFEQPSSFKKHLTSLQPGDTLETDAPSGDFIPLDKPVNYVFVAGGIGITPFRSIIAELHHSGQDFSIDLLYGNVDDQHIVFKDELEAIAQQHANFNIHYFIGDNRVDEAVLAQYKDNVDDPYFYVSGPEPMTEAFEKTLKGLGVDDQHLHLDFFPGYKAE